MGKCQIGGMIVEIDLVGVDTHGFGPALAGDGALPYSVEMGFNEVLLKFEKFYSEFIERESEDEGFLDNPGGYYLGLRDTGFLGLGEMLVAQPDLLSSVLLKVLSSEFMGYLFGEGDLLRGKKIYTADIGRCGN